LPYYKFCIKKNNIFLEVSAESDHEFIAKQMDKWSQLYTGKTAPKKKGKAEITPKKSESSKVDLDYNLVNAVQEHPAENITASIIESVEEPVVKPKIVIKAEALKPEIESKSDKIFEEELASIAEDIDYKEEFDKDVVVSEVIEETPQKEDLKSTAENKFQNILNKKISAMPELDAFDAISEIRVNKNSKDSSLKDLFKAKKPDSLLDYLLITAHYLQEYESLDRYSLKQINAKVMPFSQSPIDHAVIQKAVSLEYIEVVPDFTGMADVTEYKITPEGELYLKDN
jgi:hypothetical protein